MEHIRPPPSDIAHLLRFGQYFPFLAERRPAPRSRRWSHDSHRAKLFIVTSDRRVSLNHLPLQPEAALFCFNVGSIFANPSAWIEFAGQLVKYLDHLQSAIPSLQHIGVQLFVGRKDLSYGRVVLRHLELTLPYFRERRTYYLQCNARSLPLNHFKLSILDFVFNKVHLPNRPLHLCPVLGHGPGTSRVAHFHPDCALQTWVIRTYPPEATALGAEGHPIQHIAASDPRVLQIATDRSCSSRFGAEFAPNMWPQAGEYTRLYLSAPDVCLSPHVCPHSRQYPQWHSCEAEPAPFHRPYQPTSPRHPPPRPATPGPPPYSASPGPESIYSGPTESTWGTDTISHRSRSPSLDAYRPPPSHSPVSASRCVPANSPDSTVDRSSPTREVPVVFVDAANNNHTPAVSVERLPTSPHVQEPAHTMDPHGNRTHEVSTPPPVASSRGSSCSPSRQLLLAAVLLLLLLPLSQPLTFKESSFVAYDCSRPENKTVVQAPGLQPCQVSEPIRQQNQTYLLLQAAISTRIPGDSCQIIQSRIVFRRGVYDHAIIAPHMSLFFQPHPVPVSLCHEMWRTMKYTDALGHKHDLQANGTTMIQYYEAGSCAHNEDRSDLECTGADWIYKNQKYEGMIVSMQLDITLRQEELIVNNADKTVLIHRTQIEMPCRFPTGGCSHPSEGTLVWDPYHSSVECPLYKLRITSGIDVTDKQGEVLFLSQDGSMVRLERNQPESICQQVVFHTQYPHLLLTSALGHFEFNRPLHPSEMSTVTYANQQDSFLYGELTSLIKREYSAVRHHVCLSKMQHEKGAYAKAAAEQKALRDGETVFLGEGMFALASGEVWYRYQCRPVQVIALNRDDCYDALPVKLMDDDYQRYLQMRTPPEQEPTPFLSWNTPRVIDNETTFDPDPEFFLEPHSHLLVTLATPTPCTPEFAPIYRNAYDQYIMASPTLRQVPKPVAIYDPKDEPPPALEGKASSFNFHEGGIYTSNSVLKMEKYYMAPRAARGLNARLAARLHTSAIIHPNRPILSSDLFDDIPRFSSLMPFMPLWQFLLKWGSLCSALFGILAIFRFISWIGGLLFRVFTDLPLVGCSPKLLLVCCPAARDFFHTRYHNQIRNISLKQKWLQLKQRFQTHAKPSAPDGDLTPAALYPPLPSTSCPSPGPIDMEFRATASTLPSSTHFGHRSRSTSPPPLSHRGRITPTGPGGM